MNSNPYDYEYSVQSDEMFFGRKELLNEIVNHCCASRPRSFAIFGGRRAGKTSFLRAVERRLVKRMEVKEDPIVVPIHFDLQIETIQSRGGFFALVIQRLRDAILSSPYNVALDDDYLNQLQAKMKMESELLPQLDFEKALAFICRIVSLESGSLRVVLLVGDSERISGQDWVSELYSNLHSLLTNRPKIQNRLCIIMTGSSKFYANVVEEGSPLRYILTKRLLLPLSQEETTELITMPSGITVNKDVVDEIVSRSGGHPLLTQYLMHHLWEAGISGANVESVQEIARSFADELDVFEGWRESIGPEGQRIYSLLCEREGWTKRLNVYQMIQGDRTALKTALESLCYHGLIIEDKRWGFCLGGRMFQDWYMEHHNDFHPSQPTLPTSEYENILQIIHNMGLVIERSPASFTGMGEEDLRQHFLMQLNGPYKGQAIGEALNGLGKTDILIRVNGKNIFIAECKFWGGPKVLTATIDQLLGYVTWRDTKTAVLLFSRNKGFSAVLAQIPEVVQAHPCFEEELGIEEETVFRYSFHQPDDPSQKLLLTIMAFDVHLRTSGGNQS